LNADAFTLRVLGHVKRNPGVTCAGVATALGITPAVAGALLRSLRSAKYLRSAGNTRGMRYYARR
jgi:DNA-binding IclR family transcriptional regulator